ncbi:hypothetical protein KKA53_05245 [Candidatus Dependentiae bacterium]|nr:hypothetical protein [Candidatus Dependentiae bacterium]
MSTSYQFTIAEILIQPYAVAIGPFTFDLSNQLPSGDDIDSVTVVSTLGGVETTDDLISGTPTVASNIVTMYFDYPGATRHGKHKITFKYTLVSGAKDEADFYKVVVADV